MSGIRTGRSAAAREEFCAYCGGYAGEVDHVMPRAAGGRDTPDNLVGCCIPCNRTASGWVFPSFEDKKRYILLRRFHSKTVATKFRDQVGAVWPYYSGCK